MKVYQMDDDAMARMLLYCGEGIDEFRRRVRAKDGAQT